jgi:von Willebrand factor type A domain
MKITLPKSDTATNQPTNYFWVVDNSYSMNSSVKQLKDTLRSIKDYLNPQDTCSIAWFSGRGAYDWIIKGASITNANIDQLIEKQIYARGMTAFNEVLSSLVETVDNVSAMSGNKHNVLVFMTDGHSNDGYSDDSIIRVCANIASKQTFQEVRIIGYSSYYNRELLVDMSKTLNGQFSHISNHVELDNNYKEIVKNKKSIKNTPLDQKYDLLWQVSNEISVYNQKDDNSVDVLDTQDESILYGINWDELGTFTGTNDAKFVYSLALVLSKQNKPNLGVQILYKAGDIKAAKMLQKAFTVAQKGRAENELLIKVLTQN